MLCSQWDVYVVRSVLHDKDFYTPLQKYMGQNQLPWNGGMGIQILLTSAYFVPSFLLRTVLSICNGRGVFKFGFPCFKMRRLLFWFSSGNNEIVVSCDWSVCYITIKWSARDCYIVYYLILLSGYWERKVLLHGHKLSGWIEGGICNYRM